MSRASWLRRRFGETANKRPRSRPKLAVEALEDRRVPASFTPDIFTDEFDGNFDPGDLSLREAVHLANTTPGADTITLLPGTYVLSLAGRAENSNATGDLDVSDAAGLSIIGPATAAAVIDASGIDRVFEVVGSGVLHLTGVIVQGGSETNGGGFSVAGQASLTIENSILRDNLASNRGGGVDNNGGSLTVINSRFESNVAGVSTSAGVGGAINNGGGDVSIQDSEFIGNRAFVEGGAISDRSGVIGVTASTFTGNRADAAAGGGGAISTLGTIIAIADSTFTGNIAVKGGAIQGRGEVTITGSLLQQNEATIQAGTSNLGGALYNTNFMKVVNSTIVGNVAGSGRTVFGFGGAIENTGGFQLIHATVTGNSASDGGGIRNSGSSVFTVTNSIIAQNTTTAAGNRLDVWGDFDSLGGNFLGFAGGGTGWIDSDIRDSGLLNPQLGPLQDNGGPTLTRAPLDGSPVLDAGVDGAGFPANVTLPDTDQRGLPRPSGGGFDIGAYERQAAPPVNRPPVAGADSYVVDEDSALNVPVVGPSALDQQSEPIGWWFNAGLGQYDWQQQVRAGAGGLLTAVEFFLGANSAPGAAFEFYVNRGPAWQTAPDDFAFPVTVTSDMLGQWVAVDVSSAGIFLDAGDYFTWGARNGNGQTALLLGSAENETGDAYPDGKLWRNGAPLGSSTNFDLRFRTHVAADVGLLANDSDPDGDPLTAVLVSGPSHGALDFNTDGSFTYTPDADYHGPDSFTYRAFDGELSSDIATVSLTINPVNDAPTANGDAYSVDQNGSLAISAAQGVLANDNDVDGDALAAVLVAGPANGTLTLNADGSFTYTPDFRFHGTDSFTYQAADGQAASAPATVTIVVEQVTHTPPIEIDPGDSTNTINLNKDSKIEVAILSTATFDAQDVIVESLRFGKTGTEDSLWRHHKTGLAVGDTQAILRGELSDGSLLEAADLVNLTASNKPGKGRK